MRMDGQPFPVAFFKDKGGASGTCLPHALGILLLGSPGGCGPAEVIVYTQLDGFIIEIVVARDFPNCVPLLFDECL